MINLITFLAIVISIAYGFKTKRNAGFLAIAFAYLIGCFVLDMKPSEVISCWPMKIFSLCVIRIFVF